MVNFVIPFIKRKQWRSDSVMQRPVQYIQQEHVAVVHGAVHIERAESVCQHKSDNATTFVCRGDDATHGMVGMVLSV